MAGSRKPGPLGSSGQHDAIDTGTLNRQLSPTPGPTCVSHGTPAASVLQLAGHQGDQPRRKHVGGIRPVEPVNFPELRLNSRGPEVQKLQRLLNSRLEGATPLKVDGWFGPRTREALLQAQAKFHLASDGIVGPKTWFRLVSAPISKTAKPDSGRTLPGSRTPSASEVSVVEWPVEKRFDYVITETGKRLPANMRAQFIAMVTGTGRNILIGTFVIWAGGHLFGVSEIADAILLVAGVFFLGVGIFEASYDLTTFLMLTCSASTEADLNRAADNLAQAITLLGVMTFFALMAKVTDVVGKGAPTEEAAPPPEEPRPTVRARRPAPKEPPPAKEPPPPPPKEPPVPTNPAALAKAISDAPEGSAERAVLVDKFAKMSTHVKGSATRVVLGRWSEGGGYIAEARANGGVWYETPEGTYKILGEDGAWETNQAFLRQQMEAGVPKMEFTGMDVDTELANFADTPNEAAPARINEIRYLQDNAEKYGYIRQGNSFVKVK